MLELKDKVIDRRYSLEVGETYLVGRENNPRNNIILPWTDRIRNRNEIYKGREWILTVSRVVSRTHFRLYVDGDETLRLTDMSSEGIFDEEGKKIFGTNILIEPDIDLYLGGSPRDRVLSYPIRLERKG